SLQWTSKKKPITPGMVNKNIDLEFYSLQPCFYPDEDRFLYFARLLLTPPLSPRPGWIQEHPPRGPVCGRGGSLGAAPGPRITDNARSIIIQDCMWSGSSARGKLERAASERPQSEAPPPPGAAGSQRTGSDSSGCSGKRSPRAGGLGAGPGSRAGWGAPCGGRCGGRRARTGGSVPPAPPHVSAAVGPEPSPRSSSGQEGLRGAKDPPGPLTVSCPRGGGHGLVRIFSVRIMSVLFSVLSYQKKYPKNTTFSSVRTRQNGLILKCCTPVHQQHDYATPSPFVETEETPPQKKIKVPCPVKPTIQPKPKCSNSGNSDSEDSERRHHHCILERRRRNALRTQFLKLRDHIPGLVKNEKATKAMILKKAAEYFCSLQAEEQKLLLEKKKLQARQEQLLKKLNYKWTC
uniref:BHLH domain-containing protein n=1 Tax=Malurus cyaneus samueli TaxID=2593467 RepID=A0A8C5U859_9PASS